MNCLPHTMSVVCALGLKKRGALTNPGQEKTANNDPADCQPFQNFFRKFAPFIVSHIFSILSYKIAYRQFYMIGVSFLLCESLNYSFFLECKSALMPGRVPFARKSSIAPPPVETNVNFFSNPSFEIRASESPPPTTDSALLFAIIFKRSMVPLSNPSS